MIIGYHSLCPAKDTSLIKTLIKSRPLLAIVGTILILAFKYCAREKLVFYIDMSAFEFDFGLSLETTFSTYLSA